MLGLSKEYEQFFAEFVKNTEQDLIAVVTSNKSRFPNYEKLVCHYRNAISRVRGKGGSSLREFHEAHNELCTAVMMLEDKSEPILTKLEYEPKIDSCDKRFDFQTEMSEGPTRYIEVKTIHPISKDDWDKYQNARKKGRFPEDTYWILYNEGLGGELYHNAYAARRKMLEYALVVEEKIEACIEKVEEKVTFLALFTNGYSWHLDELEDFVFFYRKGIHFPGDIFAKMEEYFVNEENIKLKKSIDHFAFFKRPDAQIRPNRGVRSVTTPNTLF